MDLKCKKLDCKNNDKFSCMCNSICVNSRCNCQTYDKNHKIPKEQKQDVSKTMFEFAPDMHPFRHNKKININCKATECLFNKDKCCCANGITVINDKEYPLCATNVKE